MNYNNEIIQTEDGKIIEIINNGGTYESVLNL